MKSILKNPLTIWFSWFVKSRLLLFKNRGKHLSVGYMSTLNNVQVGNYNTFYNNIILSNCIIDDYVYVGVQTKIKNTTIGKYCSIGSNVKVGLGMHPTNYLSTFPAFFSIRNQCQISFVDKNYFEEIGNVVIGNDVWIGDNVIIMDNISIGDGAIIATGAVVTKDIPPYTIAGGVPAKIIKKRFNDEKIQEITKMRWWDNDIEWIKHNIDFFTKIF